MKDNLRFSRLLLLGLLISSFGALLGNNHIAATTDDWPTSHHDAARTGASTGSAPHTNRLAASFTLPGYVANGLMVAADGSLFFAASGPLYQVGVYALDAATGVVRWTYTTPTSGGSIALTFADGRLFHSWWNATCAVLGGHGRCVTWDVQVNVYAYNASKGAVLWTNKQNFQTEDLGVGDLAESGGILYASDALNVRAFNSTTGAFIWNDPMSGWLTVADGIVSIGPSTLSTLYALNSSTGRQLWNYNLLLNLNGYPGNVICCDHDFPAEGEQIFLTYVNWPNSPGIIAFNTTSRIPTWKTTAVGGSYFGLHPVVIHGDLLYAESTINGSRVGISALNRTTGGVVWESSSITRIFAYANGLIFAAGGYSTKDLANHAIYALNASTGFTVWSYAGLSRDPTGLVAGARLYVLTGNDILVFEDGAGSPDFDIPMPPPIQYQFDSSWLTDSVMIGLGINSQNNFQGYVTLAAAGLPSQANMEWSLNPVELSTNEGVTDTLIFNLTHSQFYSDNIYTIQIHANSGGITHTYTFQLSGASPQSHPVFEPFAIPLILIFTLLARRRKGGGFSR